MNSQALSLDQLRQKQVDADKTRALRAESTLNEMRQKMKGLYLCIDFQSKVISDLQKEVALGKKQLEVAIELLTEKDLEVQDLKK
tara:strand:+ start:342 stop:596 length:255 start_codon:yes stop_codon:yes gene_type:complete